MLGFRDRPSAPVRSLLERERDIPALPAAVRGRALARARAALAVGITTEHGSSMAPRRMRFAAAAALVFLASGAAATAAYRIGMRARPVAPTVELSPTPSAPSSKLGAKVEAKLVVEPPTAAPTSVPAAPAAPSKVDAAREELRLLRQARAAVARRDFAAALPPLAEHARRFRDGRLAEEREALRVKALAGLGRTDEARRAAAAFEARFPRSVLSPIVSQMPASTP